MEITNTIIEVIYYAGNALFPFFLLFFVAGFIYDMSKRRAKQ